MNGTPARAHRSMKTQNSANMRVRAISSWNSASAGDEAERATDGGSVDGADSRRARSSTVSARASGGTTGGTGTAGPWISMPSPAGAAGEIAWAPSTCDAGKTLPPAPPPGPRVTPARDPSCVGSSSPGVGVS